MSSNICLYCICRETCKLTEPILTVCPIFPSPPTKEDEYTQQELPNIHWSSKEGTEMGGGG